MIFKKKDSRVAEGFSTIIKNQRVKSMEDIMDNKKSVKYLFFALIISIFFLPMQAFSFDCPTDPDDWYCDGFDDYDESAGKYKFHSNWKASGTSNDYTRGYWTILKGTDFTTAAVTEDPAFSSSNRTFARINVDSADQILYRQEGNIANSKNYQVTATISAGDNDRLGIAFYYINDKNYYRLTIDNDEYNNASSEYPHSIFLTRHTDEGVELLAISPLPGTHHAVKPYSPITLRVKVITNDDQKFILAQYYNPSIGDYVNLFDGTYNPHLNVNNPDGVYIDSDTSIDYGWAGVYASYMKADDDGGRLHHIDVKHITSINEIIPVGLPDDVSDPYLLDYKVDDDGFATVQITYKQYTTSTSGSNLYWFIDLEDDELPVPIDTNAKSADETVVAEVPPGKHTVYLYENPDGTGLAGAKELWVSSKSAFTIAMLPDLHVGQSTYRDFQIEGIMKEIRKRADKYNIFATSTEDDIKACIQAGDMAFRGKERQLGYETTVNGVLYYGAAYYFSKLPMDMPIITTIGNHDYVHETVFNLGITDLAPHSRNSRYPDEYIFDVVTSSNRAVAPHYYGVEIPNEVDNMYYLFDEEYLGGAGSGKWLVISLQPDPMKKDVFWAEKIIKRYNNYNVILVTHQFLTEGGHIEDDVVRHWSKAGPLFYDANSAKDVWGLLQKYGQIKIILDGHTTTQGGLFTKTIERDCGNDVLVIMTDVSFAHTWQGAGGQFRLLEIDPESSKVRGRLVYARTPVHIGSAYDGYNIEQQVINTKHSDAYFIKDINLSNDNSLNVRLFADFNDFEGFIESDCSDDCFPSGWTAVDDAGGSYAPDWHVDMTNETDSADKTNSRETNITERMTKFGRVQEVGNAYSCNDNKFLKGTYLVYDNQDAKDNWSNYTFELDLSAGDNDGIGVMFYYTEEDDEVSYYRFSMFRGAQCGQKAGYYSLEKVVDGERYYITSGQKAYSTYKPYKIVVDLSTSGKIKIDVFDTLSKEPFIPIDVDDSEPLLTKGTIALYSWGMGLGDYGEKTAGAIFDNVLVTKGGPEQAGIRINDGITAPVPDMSSLPVIRGECSAEVTSSPTATSSCGAQIIGTTSDPLVYHVQGTYTITWTYTDSSGNSATQKQTIIVQDTIPPTIEDLAASPDVLWPPNHKMVPVSVSVTVSDNCDPSPTCEITSVVSNESQISEIKADKFPDWEITDEMTVNLRAERYGCMEGRVYAPNVTCSDYAGNSATDQAIVIVPHESGNGKKK